MELRFHTTPSIFYDKDGNLLTEPKESLEELEQKYKENCAKHHEFMLKLKKMEEKYSTKIMDYDGSFKNVVDYELWELEDEKSFYMYAFASFNSDEWLDSLEFKIDLKIMHINKAG